MSPALEPAEADRRLRKMAQLRALFHRLPRLMTPARQRQLAEFQSFLEGVSSCCSAEIARAALEEWWRAGDDRSILEAEKKLPAELRDSDRDVAMYLHLAALRQSLPR